MGEFNNRRIKVGNALHKMRKNKKLSLSDFSDIGLSPSFLSRVENGESGISLDRLYILLNKLDVSFTEFTNETDLNTYLEFTTAYHTIKSASYSQNLPELITLLHMYQNLHHETRGSSYEHLALITEAQINNFTSTNLSKYKIKKLSDHLFNIDIWYQYDLMLFAGTIRQLPLQTASVFVDDLFKKLDRQTTESMHTELIFQIISQLILMFIDYSDFSSAHRTIEHLGMVIKSSHQVHYSTKTKLLFYKGILQIISGHKNGIHQCQKAIEIINLLDDNQSIGLYYQKYLNNFSSCSHKHIP